MMDIKQNQTKPATSRLFFALWPGTVTAAELSIAGKCLHDTCGGRLTRLETIHLTLVFLGAVVSERIDELLGLAAEIKAPVFEIGLTQLGWWPHNRIAWAAPKKTPEELFLLVEQLSEKLRNAGFLFDEQAFEPHVTLLRKGACKGDLFSEINIGWRAEEFVLVRSVSGEGGAAYEVLGRWPLK